MVVKPKATRTARAENIHQRLSRLIAEVVDAREYPSQTAFLKKANISSGFMRALELRAQKNPGAKLSHKNATSLARLLGASVEYINDGTRADTGLGDRYPGRGKAVTAARALDFPEAAIRLVLAERSPNADGSDPGTRYWFLRLQAEEVRLSPSPARDDEIIDKKG